MHVQLQTARLAEHFSAFLPSLQTILVVAPIAIASAIVFGFSVGYLRVRRGVRVPYTRKLYHFAVFTLAGVVQLIWGVEGVVVLGSVFVLAVLYAVVRGTGSPLFEALARPTDEPHRTAFVLVPLATTALGGILANLFFLKFAWVGYLVCGWGDAVGEPVGTRWGRHRYRVPSLGGIKSTRSLEGSAAVLLVGWAAACTGLLAAGFSLVDAVRMGSAAALAGAAVEAVSNHGLDNLTVQIAAAAGAFFTSV
jgi:phytol kinase